VGLAVQHQDIAISLSFQLRSSRTVPTRTRQTAVQKYCLEFSVAQGNDLQPEIRNSTVRGNTAQIFSLKSKVPVRLGSICHGELGPILLGERGRQQESRRDEERCDAENLPYHIQVTPNNGVGVLGLVCLKGGLLASWDAL
jgi:hypothetical protein